MPMKKHHHKKHRDCVSSEVNSEVSTISSDSNTSASEDSVVSATMTRIHLDSRTKVFICIPCERGLTPNASSIAKHYRGVHDATSEQTKVITDFVKTISSPSDPRIVKLPADGSKPIEFLPTRPGYKCRTCTFLTIDTVAIEKHLKKCSGRHEVNPTPRSTADKSDKHRDWTSVMLQTFDNPPTMSSRYWFVDEDVPEDEVLSVHTDPSDTSVEEEEEEEAASYDESKVIAVESGSENDQSTIPRAPKRMKFDGNFRDDKERARFLKWLNESVKDAQSIEVIIS